MAPSGHEQAARTAEAERNWEQAWGHWSQAHEVNPDIAKPLVGMGRVRTHQRRWSEARALFEQALSIESEHRGALNGIAALFEAQGQWADALAQWQLIEDLKGPGPQSSIGKAANLARLGREEEADTVIDAALLRTPDHLSLLRYRFRSAKQQSNFTRVLDTLDTMLATDPDNTSWRTERANAANHLSKSELFLTEIRWLDEHFWHAAAEPSAEPASQATSLAQWADIMARSGGWNRISEHISRLVESAAGSPTQSTLRFTAAALVGMGDLVRLRQLAHAVDQAACDDKAVTELADIWIKLEEPDRATECLALAPAAHHRAAIELRAWADAQAGDVEQAQARLSPHIYPRSGHYIRTLGASNLGNLRAHDTSPQPSLRDDTTLAGQLVVISVCRDERLRIDPFLAHYRAMGVDRFLIVDNGSTDDTAEVLAQAEDVHLFHADGFYRETGSGRRWINTLLGRYCQGAWSVVADVDEHLVFGSQTGQLRELTDRLDASGADLLFAPMLDMHGEDLNAWRDFERGAPLQEVFRWFDVRTQLIGSRHSPYLDVSGGFRNHAIPSVMPEALLGKPALVRGGTSIKFLNSHITTPSTASPETGAFLHYKFATDPRPRSGFASSKGVFARNLADHVDTGQPLVSEWSREFESAKQLQDLGLLRRDH